VNISHKEEAEKKRLSWLEIVLKSWLAIGALGLYAIILIADYVHHGHVGDRSELVIGFLALFALVLAMNTMAKTNILLYINPKWWVENRVFRWLHMVADEGEWAGIGLGTAFIALYQSFSGHYIDANHVPFSMGITLLGIMSGAGLVQQKVAPVYQRIEKWLEKNFGLGRVALVVLSGGSSSFIGEPGGAQVAGSYFRGRVRDENLIKVGTGLAAAIGSGGALLWFAAPPILIVQGKLTAVGWNLTTLIFMVGLPAMIQVIWVAVQIAPKIETIDLEKPNRPIEWLPLAAFGSLVMAHMVVPSQFMPIVYAVDIVVGIVYIFDQVTELLETGHGIDQHSMGAVMQPLVLATLLIVLELVGHIATPFVEIVGNTLVHLGIEGFALVLALFVLTAVVSAFADNALASFVLVTIPLSVLEGGEAVVGAAAVIMGALYGGIALPPSNLPNFKFYRDFNFKGTAEWLQGSRQVAITGLVYIGCLAGQWFAMKAGWLNWVPGM
jgi:hypothetical protein